jgi:hypothetical protein
VVRATSLSGDLCMRRVTIQEDSLSHIVLAKTGVTSRTKRVTNFLVLISAVPASGQLHQECYLPSATAHLYTGLCDTASVANGDVTLEPIVANGTAVVSTRGIVLYAPIANEFGTNYAVFRYRCAQTSASSLCSLRFPEGRPPDGPPPRCRRGMAGTPTLRTARSSRPKRPSPSQSLRRTMLPRRYPSTSTTPTVPLSHLSHVELDTTTPSL